jgi:hypothetical protein
LSSLLAFSCGIEHLRARQNDPGEGPIFYQNWYYPSTWQKDLEVDDLIEFIDFKDGKTELKECLSVADASHNYQLYSREDIRNML